jgi:hypothetical protein
MSIESPGRVFDVIAPVRNIRGSGRSSALCRGNSSLRWPNTMGSKRNHSIDGILPDSEVREGGTFAQETSRFRAIRIPYSP